MGLWVALVRAWFAPLPARGLVSPKSISPTNTASGSGTDPGAKVHYTLDPVVYDAAIRGLNILINSIGRRGITIAIAFFIAGMELLVQIGKRANLSKQEVENLVEDVVIRAADVVWDGYDSIDPYPTDAQLASLNRADPDSDLDTDEDEYEN
jgi:hypothetical protein